MESGQDLEQGKWLRHSHGMSHPGLMACQKEWICPQHGFIAGSLVTFWKWSEDGPPHLLAWWHEGRERKQPLP
jgi:hypothetical protein